MGVHYNTAFFHLLHLLSSMSLSLVIVDCQLSILPRLIHLFVFSSHAPSRPPSLSLSLRYRLLDVLEFTSKRKRMSVIMRDSQTNKLILWCKGADSVIYSKLRKEFIDGDGPEKV